MATDPVKDLNRWYKAMYYEVAVANMAVKKAIENELKNLGVNETETPVLNIREAVQAEIQKQVKNLFGNELTEEAKNLILTCPQLINRLAANLSNAIDNFSDDDEPLEPIEIQHVGYTKENMGYDK